MLIKHIDFQELISQVENMRKYINDSNIPGIEKLGLDLKRITETYMNDIQDFEGTHTFLTNLQSMKKTIIIVSNAHRDTINIKLTKTKLWGYFDDVISSHDFSYPKEDINFWINLEKNL